jgi:hypothetical protein
MVERAEVDRFYQAAMVGLAVLDGRMAGSRRFGPDADARWKAFQGGLREWHRVDLLVRDAAVRNPAAFAPGVVFALPALAEDEPFGPDWPGTSPVQAGELIRAVGASPREVEPALAAVATAWGLAAKKLSPGATAGIQPSTRILLAGAGAVLSIASAFAGRPELDLGDQSVLVADDPGTRQLFGMTLAFLDSRRPARIVTSDARATDVQALGLASLDLALVSDDTPPEVRQPALSLAQALGARG